MTPEIDWETEARFAALRVRHAAFGHYRDPAPQTALGALRVAPGEEKHQEFAYTFLDGVTRSRRRIDPKAKPIPHNKGKRKSKLIALTPEQIRTRLGAGETVTSMAAEVGCLISLLSHHIKARKIASVERLCVDCGLPTNRAKQAARCKACAQAEHMAACKRGREEERAALAEARGIIK